MDISELGRYDLKLKEEKGLFTNFDKWHYLKILLQKKEIWNVFESSQMERNEIENR